MTGTTLPFWHGGQVMKMLARLFGPRVAEIAEMWGKATGSSTSQPGELITEEAVSGFYLLVRHKPLI